MRKITESHRRRSDHIIEWICQNPSIMPGRIAEAVEWNHHNNLYKYLKGEGCIPEKWLKPIEDYLEGYGYARIMVD